VIVSLQRTQMDELAALRIFAPLDEVFTRLLEQLAIPLAATQSTTSSSSSSSSSASLTQSVYRSLPYCPATGDYDSSSSTTLDLRPGAVVRIVNQPAWGRRRVRATTAVWAG